MYESSQECSSGPGRKRAPRYRAILARLTIVPKPVGTTGKLLVDSMNKVPILFRRSIHLLWGKAGTEGIIPDGNVSANFMNIPHFRLPLQL